MLAECCACRGACPVPFAMEMMLTGSRLTAREAMALGLVNEVTRADGLMAAARSLATRVLASAPLSAQAIKAVMRATETLSVEDGYRLMQEGGIPAYDRLRRSHDYFEGARAFAEKRAPVWQGR